MSEQTVDNQRQPEPGSQDWIEKTMSLVELIADAEHANGAAVGRIHRRFLREHLAAVRPVFLVATGEGHDGQETYTRHDDAPPPLCEFEVLYSQPGIPKTDRQPTVQDVVAYLKGERGPLHELIDEMVRNGVAKAIAQKRAAPAEKAIAWEVDQAGQISVLSAAEFTRRSFDYGAMRPLVYGDTPARMPLNDFELECLRIGKAVQRAAEELPEAYELQVLVEKGAGTLRLCDPDAENIHLSDRDGGLSLEIEQAIDTAVQHAKAS